MATPTPAEAREEILNSAAVTLTTACAAMRVSQATGSRMIAAGKFPVPIVRMGSRVIVPTEPLRKALYIDDGDTADDAAGETVAAAAQPAGRRGSGRAGKGSA